MSFYIKNLTGSAVDIDDLGLQVEAGSAGSQTIDIGGAQLLGSTTGLSGATVYTATITVDGGTPQAISVIGSAATTYTTLLDEINADLTGAQIALTGGDLVLTSDTTGTGSILVADTDLFSSLTTYVGINAAIAGTGVRDMLYEEAGDVQASVRFGDLLAAINADQILVLDPKDGVSVLTKPESIRVGSIHNDPNWGINGGVLNDLDDVDTSLAVAGDVLVFGPGGLTVSTTTPAAMAADIAIGDLNNVTDGTTPTASDFFILAGTAGGEFTVQDGLTNPLLIDATTDIAGNLIAGATQTDLTITYNPATNAMVASVDDSYLRNDGDTLDSGILTVAAGASIAVDAAGTITWASQPSSPNELANKAYVDSKVTGSTWRAPIIDPNLVEITATNPGTMASLITTYGLAIGESIAFISSAAITFDAGGTTVVGTGAGDIVNLTVVSGTVGDYSLIETPLSIGDRFIIAGEDGTVGAVLGALDVNSDTFTLSDADLIEYTGGAVTAAGSWSTPEGRSGQAGGGTEIVQGITVLASDPDSTHYGHTYSYDQTSNVWYEIAGPGQVGDGTGLSYTGTVLNVNMGAGIAELPTDEVGIDLYDAANGAIILTTDGSARATTNATKLHLLLDGSTLTQTATGLKLAAGGITETELASSVAGLGIAGGAGTPLSLAPNELTDTVTEGADVIVLGDNSAAEAPIKRSITDLLADNNIVNNITGGNGMVVQTAADTYVARTIAAATNAGDQGISIVDGDGVAGNPVIGVDITGQTLSIVDLTATDEVLVFDGANNIKYTGQQIADGVSTILGGLSGNAWTTINGDTGTATAGTADTLNIVGATNGGIVTAVTATPDTLTLAVDVSDLPAGVGSVDVTDLIIVGEGANTVSYTIQEVIDDLGLVNGVAAGVGLIVGDGAGNYSNVSIAVDGVGNLDGLAIANADGTAGAPTVGLDINGTPAAGEDMAVDDKFVVYNTSGTANETLTGQEVADGVATALGLGGLSVANVSASTGTQPVLVLADTTRANKLLSVGDTSVNWSENNVGNNDWLQIGGAVDALTGYIVPLNATIVKVTAHTSDANGRTKPFSLYINGTLNGTVATLSGAAEDTYEDVTLDIDIAAGDKLRLRGGTGGRIEDTVITLWLKWRG